MRGLRIKKQYLTILTIIGVVGSFAAPWLISQQAVAALSQTTYTPIDMSDPWTVVRGSASGGYTASANSVAQSVDSTVDPGDTSLQTEVLAKTIPDSSAVRAKITIDPDWQSKPVRVGLWGEVYNSTDPSAAAGWPIIEFASTDDGTKAGGDSNYVGFRVYDTRGGVTPKWYNLTDVPFTWGQTYELTIAYNAQTEDYDFYVDTAKVLSLPASRSSNSPRDTFRMIELATFNSVTNDSTDNYSATWQDASYGTTTLVPDTATLSNATDGKSVKLTIPANATLTASSSEQSSSVYPDTGYQYPLGLINYSLTTSETDNPITLVFETDLSPNQVVARKYNPTTHTYSTIEDANITETTYNGKHALQLAYTVTDNGSLDLDPAVGTISDPVGLALVPGVPDTGLPRSSNTLVAVAFGAAILVLMTIAATTLKLAKRR